MDLSKKITLYQVLDMLDKKLTPRSKKFSEYVKWSSDDNGFLRTCFCKKSETLKDRYISQRCTCVIVGFEWNYDKHDLVFVSRDDPFDYIEPLTKMQICFVSEDAVDDKLKWNIDMGYRYCIVFDLKSEKVVAVIKE